MLYRSVVLTFLLAFSLLFGGTIMGGVQSARGQVEATTPTKSVAVIPPSDQPDLAVSSAFQEPSGNDTLDASEKGTLEVTVTNRGRGPAQDVQVRMTAESATPDVQVRESSLKKGTFFKIGKISSLSASTSKTFSLPVRAAKMLSGTPVQLSVEVSEKHGFAPSTPHSVRVPVETYTPPALAVAGFDVKGASEQKLKRDTTNQVTLRVENTGKGPARSVRANVQVVKGGELLSKAGAAMKLGTVPPSSDTALTINVKTGPNAESVPLRVLLSSAEDPYKTTEEVTLPVAAPDRPPLVDRKIPETPTSRENAIAVVIGVRNYRNAGVPNVDYAKRDAKVMKKYLHKTLGFRKGNIIELINPTKAEMDAVFGTEQTPKARLADYLRTDSSEVFVYYSGHGAPNPEENGRTYFLPSNGSPSQLSITGYPVKQLYENLSKLTSGPVTVAVDACFSGQSEGGALVKKASPALLSVENPMVGMKNGMVLTASQANQISSWYPEKKHGLFTYFLLKGLRGEADQNQNDLLTGKELKTYLSENVSYYARRLHSRTQNPQIMGKGADRVLAYYSKKAKKKAKKRRAKKGKSKKKKGGKNKKKKGGKKKKKKNKSNKEEGKKKSKKGKKKKDKKKESGKKKDKKKKEKKSFFEKMKKSDSSDSGSGNSGSGNSGSGSSGSGNSGSGSSGSSSSGSSNSGSGSSGSGSSGSGDSGSGLR